MPDVATDRLKTLWGKAKAHASRALDVFYPPVCMACHRAIDTHGALCPTCWSQMRFIEHPYCDRLGTPFDQDLGVGMLSPEVAADPPAYNCARAVVTFEDGPARQLVHRLKYGDRLDIAAPMGRWMARAGEDILRDANLIVPVPLHRQRLFKRRFNQAASLAKVIANEAGHPTDLQALQRIKKTQPQVGMTKAQRAQNLQGAFRVAIDDRPSIEGRNIVLVDDVLTTGSTLNAAARALLRAKAARVDVLVFARVVRQA